MAEKFNSIVPEKKDRDLLWKEAPLFVREAAEATLLLSFDPEESFKTAVLGKLTSLKRTAGE